MSLPYPLGPEFEYVEEGVRILWLLPITAGEADMTTRAGIDVFEELMETQGVNFLDPRRPSVA
ncbi:suppressor of fused domain protein [Planotetraspora mira]|uniref:Suppressor of fused-like domain-containing protein n=1 Tax=Planotetraspora mira TaxID=58121 RepID=A0A8J3XBD4_9ACTN|nr:suppressor of fused domain protein [Planotetraspora mira]GII34099.1 hypothetical protein Pmi06nite_75410 [Planotetraspora mira]